MKTKSFIGSFFLIFSLQLAAREISLSGSLFPLSSDRPEDYRKEEFPEWMLELRRAEIIVIGAFPFAFLFTGLGYDYYYYFRSGMNNQFAPWPVGTGTSSWTVGKNGEQINEKYLTIILSSAILSVTIALIDWILGRIEVS